MDVIVKHIIRFLLLAILQIFIFNGLEFGYGIHMMLYPLFIMLLPFETGSISLLLLAFLMGFLIDIFSNSYGLHASSLVMMAFFRPIVFKLFSPRDGYDPIKEPSIFDMGGRWFFLVFGNLLLIHHFWFFIIEVFRIDEFPLILQCTLFSLVISCLLSVIIQILILKKVKSK